jgi:hypothetical protein
MNCAAVLLLAALPAWAVNPVAGVSGTITAVDTTASTVTFLSKTGTTVTLNVVPTTWIVINNLRHQSLTQLQTALTTATAAGQTLAGTATYDPTTMQANTIQAGSSGRRSRDD